MSNAEIENSPQNENIKMEIAKNGNSSYKNELMIFDAQNTFHFHQEIVVRNPVLNAVDTVFLPRILQERTYQEYMLYGLNTCVTLAQTILSF